MPELPHIDDVLDVYFWSLIESIWTIILFTINYYYYSCDSFISLLTPAWAVVCGSLNYAYTQKNPLVLHTRIYLYYATAT